MKIKFSCMHFPVWPYRPQIMILLLFCTSKLYGLTGMMVCGRSKLDDIGLNVLGCQADILGTMSHACDAVERVLI